MKITAGVLLCLLTDVHSSSKASTVKVIKKIENKNSHINTLFPEESFREKWDQGCLDWQDLLLGRGAQENLFIKFERKEGQYYLWGQARLKPEIGESMDDFVNSLNDLLSQSTDFKEWIFTGINEHPRKNENYFVLLNDLTVENKAPTHVLMSGPFVLKIAAFSVIGASTVELKWDTHSKLKLKCNALQNEIISNGPIRKFRMYPRKDVLDWLIGELTIFKRGDGYIDLQTRVVLKPSGLVYSLLPIKLIENELKYRAQRVFQNVIELRRKKIWGSYKAAQVEIPLSKAVQNPN